MIYEVNNFEVTSFEVSCDRCGVILDVYGTTLYLDRASAEDVALSEGWVFTDGGECYCPECSE
jgi:hypothetical protein|nr:MAG TPA: hypothetical protein [Caudoviricetes sp.]